MPHHAPPRPPLRVNSLVHPSTIERDSIKLGPEAGIGIEIAWIPGPAQKPSFSSTSKALFLLEIVYPNRKVPAETCLWLRNRP